MIIFTIVKSADYFSWFIYQSQTIEEEISPEKSNDDDLTKLAVGDFVVVKFTSRAILKE